jgi:hypothetical protein
LFARPAAPIRPQGTVTTTEFAIHAAWLRWTAA